MSRARENCTKPLPVSEETTKIKVMVLFLLTLLTSGAMAKQRLLYENEVVQCFQNWKV